MPQINDNEKTSDAHILFHSRIAPDGVIYLSLTGRITNAHLEEFSAWADEVKKLIRETAKKQSGKVLILSDAKGVTHFEARAVAVLRDLLDYDKQYQIRSAIVGANKMTHMLIDAVIALTKRTNMKQFSTEKEALIWLYSTEGSTAI